MTTIARTSFTLLLLCASVFPAAGQNASIRKDKKICFEVDSDRMANPTGLPFTATWIYTKTAKTADGAVTSTTVVNKSISRDSAGRVSIENRHPSPAKFNTNYWVDDPVKNIYFGWTEGTKEVFLWHESKSREKLRKDPQMKTTWAEPLCAEADHSPAGYKQENLGSKNILGIEAEGTLATRTLPAGFEGNVEPVTITEERWISRDLQLTLSNTLSDSRFGKATLELQSIDRLEPKPELFQFPSAHTVVAAPPATSPAN